MTVALAESPLASFITECDERVDADGATRGDIGRQHSDPRQYERNADKGCRVVGADAKEQTIQEEVLRNECGVVRSLWAFSNPQSSPQEPPPYMTSA